MSTATRFAALPRAQRRGVLWLALAALAWASFFAAAVARA